MPYVPIASRLTLSLGVLGLAVLAAPAQAQEAGEVQPSAQATFVVPSMPGEAVRVTTYERRPPAQGRLSRRYRGLRANRSLRATVPPLVRTHPVERTFSTPQHSFVRRGGSFFQVLPRQTTGEPPPR